MTHAVKLVVDSNCMRSDRLDVFLKSSPTHLAVLPDYVAMEALKGDAVIGMSQSIRIVSRYPSQVLVLKGTAAVCALSGASAGLQRRLVDVPATRRFANFCNAVNAAKRGAAPQIQRLHSLGIDAQQQLARVQGDAKDFASAGVELAKTFNSVDRMALLSMRASEEAVILFLDHAMNLAAWLFKNHPEVRHIPYLDELMNTYLFRCSVCCILLGMEYASGAGPTKATSRIRNDMVDTHIATYSTFFDGLLSNDLRAQRLSSLTRHYVDLFKQAVQ